MVNPLLSLDRLASDYCQRWRARRHSWRHRSEGGFDARRYDVAARSEADAKAFIVDRRLYRDNCVGLIRRAGLPIPPKSACWFCPFHSLREWREMRRTRPELFDRAAALEAEINERRRSLSLLRDPVYFTRRLKPLPMAVEDDGQDRLFEGCESGFCWT